VSATNVTTGLNPRDVRGAQIAATFDLCKRGDDWIVLSQSGNGTYLVRLGQPHPTCTCPDHQLRRVKCKHICAVEIGVKREEMPDGSTVVTETKRATHKQNRSALKQAQTHETARFAELLCGLCRGIIDSPGRR
jgi:hypothetical protein